MISSTRLEVNPIVLLPGRGSVYDELDKMGVQTIIHPFYCFGGQRKKLKTAIHHPTHTQLYHYLLDNWRCARFVKKELEGVHIDVVHSNTTLSTVGINLAKVLNAKHVWHVREYLPMMTNNIYGGKDQLIRKINFADARIFVSKQLMLRWGIDKTHSFIIFNAIRDEKEMKSPLNKEKYILFCSANIYSFKRPEIAIRAFAKSGVKSLGYKLRMVGECEEPQKQELIGLAESLKCADVIEWVGLTDNVRPHFEHAAAFLMCSDFEGLGRVTAEAMFYGCPVLGRNLGGTKDLIIDGYNGYLFDTEQECAELIKKVVSEDNTEIIANAQTFVRNELTEEVYEKKIMSLYKSIL